MVPLIGEGSPVQECEHAQRGQAQHQVTQDPAPNDIIAGCLHWYLAEAGSTLYTALSTYGYTFET